MRDDWTPSAEAWSAAVCGAGEVVGADGPGVTVFCHGGPLVTPLRREAR